MVAGCFGSVLRAGVFLAFFCLSTHGHRERRAKRRMVADVADSVPLIGVDHPSRAFVCRVLAHRPTPTYTRFQDAHRTLVRVRPIGGASSSILD